jgi:hypothetical protein
LDNGVHYTIDQSFLRAENRLQTQPTSNVIEEANDKGHHLFHLPTDKKLYCIYAENADFSASRIMADTQMQG